MMTNPAPRSLLTLCEGAFPLESMKLNGMTIEVLRQYLLVDCEGCSSLSGNMDLGVSLWYNATYIRCIIL